MEICLFGYKEKDCTYFSLSLSLSLSLSPFSDKNNLVIGRVFKSQHIRYLTKTFYQLKCLSFRCLIHCFTLVQRKFFHGSRNGEEKKRRWRKYWNCWIIIRWSFANILLNCINKKLKLHLRNSSPPETTIPLVKTIILCDN